MAAVNDPVGLGLVESLERPGTNVTGTTMYAPHLIGERLRTLQKVVPGLRRVAMLTNGNNANNQAKFAILYAEAQAVGIAVLQLDVRVPSDVEPVFRNAAKFGADGLLNAVDSFINSQRFAIATLAAQYNLPCVYTDRNMCWPAVSWRSVPVTKKGSMAPPTMSTRFCGARTRQNCPSR
jgi:putative ABC transport system substrate-binding protein